jgi:hypothetical protein
MGEGPKAHVAVIEVFPGEAGGWQANVGPVFGGEDLDTVPSLEGYATEVADVTINGELKRLTLYRGERTLVTWADAFDA